jgi:hypothetical protein
MSSSSTRERRGQASPLAALAALFAVCTGVSLYVVALGGVAPVGDDRNLADPTLRRAYDELAVGGVIDPTALAEANSAAPTGRRLNVTVTADGRRWAVGPRPPADEPTRVAVRVASVRFGPGAVVPGRLRVEVWA